MQHHPNARARQRAPQRAVSDLFFEFPHILQTIPDPVHLVRQTSATTNEEVTTVGTHPAFFIGRPF